MVPPPSIASIDNASAASLRTTSGPAILSSVKTPLVRQFEAAVSGPDHEVDLFGAAMTVAGVAGGTPPNPHAVARELDLIAEAVREQAGETADAGVLAQAIDHQLFTVLGFCGNSSAYDDPANSYLDQVVARRTGIPITLSLVYIEVAERIGLACDGIGYPGHFFVRCGGPQSPIYIDAFHQGARLDRAELLAGLRSVDLGSARPESFLAAVTRRQLLQRMLNNLHTIFRSQRDPAPWRLVVDLLLVIEPWNAALIGERGMLHYRLGDPQSALLDLERYVSAGQPDGATPPAAGGFAVNPGAVRLLQELRLHYGDTGGHR